MVIASSVSAEGLPVVGATANAGKGRSKKQLAPKRSSNKTGTPKSTAAAGEFACLPLRRQDLQLTRELGHKSDGETIQWLLQQAEPSIIAATGSGTIPALALAATAPSSISHPSTGTGLHPKFTDSLPSAIRPNWAVGVWPPTVGGFGAFFVPSSAASLSGAGEGSVGGFMQRIGLHGLELPEVLWPDELAQCWAAMGKQMPGLELGLSQDGHIGVLHPQALNQFYQQMGQGRGGGGDQLEHLQHHQQQHQSQGLLKRMILKGQVSRCPPIKEAIF
ncbi:hypothetical protein HPP92_024999 [Vanilla planifolia]|uniref:TCP domain-containing protein n=1 Tax=Vanilla planifolia TaxID=51239 RepID=A0A835PH21_VANPL|nr:hypothetical protein HPP92_024999 [Vanilla planifolia]